MKSFFIRELILISGYYGFDNLGDEAILEELVSELKALVPSERIVVLSNQPAKTEAIHNVRAISRWNLPLILSLLLQTKLLISGGGGLFQDTLSPKSTLYYGSLILLARALGAKALVYAQGIGPLHSAVGKLATELAMSSANNISVRDTNSVKLLREWNLAALLTADPVWLLEKSNDSESKIPNISNNSSAIKIGLSLRPSPNFDQEDLELLARTLKATLPADVSIILLPLQNKDDVPVLTKFSEIWSQLGGRSVFLEQTKIVRPSDWLSVMAQLDFLISMRLHAIILALKTAVPVVGIAYDPKVDNLLKQFRQPTLYLDKNKLECERLWQGTLSYALKNKDELTKIIQYELEAAKNLACQNINLLARILSGSESPATTSRTKGDH